MKPQILSEVEVILKVSGIASYLPEEVKDRVCRSVAIDIVAYYEQKIREIFEEIETKFSIEGVHIPAPSDWDKFIIRRHRWQSFKEETLSKWGQK